MAVQTTPHTQTQQNVNPAATDFEPGLDAANAGRGEDAKLYENNDGAQTGGTRAFNANAGRDHLPNALDERNGLGGNTTDRLPQGNAAGITSHTTEERERQEKVINS